MPSCFCVTCSSLNLSHSSHTRKLALICLLTGRLMTEMSLKLLYLVQLNPTDEETISRGKRGSDPCEALQLLSPSAERSSEKRFYTHAGMALCDSCGRAPEDQVFPASVAACLMDCCLFDGLHLCCVSAIGVYVGVHRRHV